MFKLHSQYKPTGDQPQAIEYLSNGIKEGKKFQTLLGVTGSGKTFTWQHNSKSTKATLVLAHNKTASTDNYIPSSRSFFQKTMLNILFHIMIITNQKVI